MAPTLELEKNIGGIVCGIDEAGRGPWCGPVVAAAVIVGADVIAGVNDSKKLSEKKREQLYAQIISSCQYGVGQASVQEIDDLNIIAATKLAMLRAYEALPVKAAYALIDGNSLPNLPCAMQYVIKGDSVSYSIAAASIIAKVTRDKLVGQMAAEFPQYNWHSNKGYGTKCHIEALDKYGITVHHRKSYQPIKMRLAS